MGLFSSAVGKPVAAASLKLAYPQLIIGTVWAAVGKPVAGFIRSGQRGPKEFPMANAVGKPVAMDTVGKPVDIHQRDIRLPIRQVGLGRIRWGNLSYPFACT